MVFSYIYLYIINVMDTMQYKSRLLLAVTHNSPMATHYTATSYSTKNGVRLRRPSSGPQLLLVAAHIHLYRYTLCLGIVDDALEFRIHMLVF